MAINLGFKNGSLEEVRKKDGLVTTRKKRDIDEERGFD
jgi:hypothetical protein